MGSIVRRTSVIGRRPLWPPVARHHVMAAPALSDGVTQGDERVRLEAILEQPEQVALLEANVVVQEQAELASGGEALSMAVPARIPGRRPRIAPCSSRTRCAAARHSGSASEMTGSRSSSSTARDSGSAPPRTGGTTRRRRRARRWRHAAAGAPPRAREVVARQTGARGPRSASSWVSFEPRPDEHQLPSTKKTSPTTCRKRMNLHVCISARRVARRGGSL